MLSLVLSESAMSGADLEGPLEGAVAADEAGASGGQAEPPGRVAELEDAWRRAAADLENLRRRFDRELERGRLAERERVLAAWLPVVDNLERALEHSEDPEAILSGLRMVLGQAHGVLEAFGYTRIDRAGERFDPLLHEAVSAVTPDEEHPPGYVVAVTRPGWVAADRVLRPASVVVARREG